MKLIKFQEQKNELRDWMNEEMKAELVIIRVD